MGVYLVGVYETYDEAVLPPGMSPSPLSLFPTFISTWFLQKPLRRFLGSATLNGALAYRRGRDENSAHPRVVYADLNLSLPFAAAGQRWAYQVNWRAQFDRSPLAPQDRFAIGGRYICRSIA